MLGAVIFKRVGSGRPYPDHGLSSREWAAIPPRQVRLDELVPLLRDELETATTVPVHLTADLEGAELEADPGLLRLLFPNLGRNACAYNRSNPVEIAISAQVIPQPNPAARKHARLSSNSAVARG